MVKMFTRLLYKFVTFDISQIRYKKHTYRAYVAKNTLSRALGLMHRQSLPSNYCMLFIFPRETRLLTTLTMANMHFPIDVVWLNKRLEAVDKIESAKPSKGVFTSKEYAPKEPAMYVLEFNAGTIRKIGVKLGSRFDLGDEAKKIL